MLFIQKLLLSIQYECLVKKIIKQRRQGILLLASSMTPIVPALAGAADGTRLVNNLPEVEVGPGFTQAAIDSVFPGFGAGFVAVALASQSLKAKSPVVVVEKVSIEVFGFLSN
jgi:hypothetical protein